MEAMPPPWLSLRIGPKCSNAAFQLRQLRIGPTTVGGAQVTQIFLWMPKNNFWLTLPDTIYTERYMGLPRHDDNLLGYAEAQLNDKVENIRTKQFFLVHGTLDDNVHYQQSMMLSKALAQSDILFGQQVPVYLIVILLIIWRTDTLMPYFTDVSWWGTRLGRSSSSPLPHFGKVPEPMLRPAINQMTSHGPPKGTLYSSSIFLSGCLQI